MKMIMRYFKQVYLILALLLFPAVSATAQAQESVLAQMDSVDISLLTCSPGNEAWSLYGHSAIRLEDHLRHTDYAINYGLFDLSQHFFILRFIFGLTDYQMGLEDFDSFLAEYSEEGRGVVQQKLNLSRQEKLAIVKAIKANYEPTERTYRYNFFYDNCTTRARDIIVKHINGKVRYHANPTIQSSYRQMVHQWNHHHRWMSFGCDLLLGVGADRKTNFEQQQFLPDSLRKDFANATVIESSGQYPLVKETSTVLMQGSQIESSDIWDALSPTVVFALLLVLTLAIAVFEYKRHRVLWLYDSLLLTLSGLAGIILFAMVFSQHPTVRVNLQILLLNPLSLVFVWGVSKRARRGNFHYYWKILFTCLILFFLGGLFLQKYAAGMWLLACTLLVRTIINRWLCSSRTTGNRHSCGI